jgi:hypothetical protein
MAGAPTLTHLRIEPKNSTRLVRLTSYLRIYPLPFPFASWRLGGGSLHFNGAFHVDRYPGSACAQH